MERLLSAEEAHFSYKVGVTTFATKLRYRCEENKM